MSNFLAKYRIIWFIAICLLLLIPVSVSAIGVTGSKYLGSIPPGGTDTHTITVDIGSDENPTDILVEVYGFGQNPDQSYASLDAADDISPYSARTFITLDKSSFHLEPGASQTVNAKISVPANVGAGGRYALIYIHALPGKGQAFTTAVLVPVLITIAGTTPTVTGSITNLSVGEVTVGQPVTVITTFKNTGNYHYYHTVNAVTVSDANGNLVGNATTQPSIYAIIPGNTVQYTAIPNMQNLPVGNYTVDSKVLLEDGTVLDEKNTTLSIMTKYVPPVTESSITISPSVGGVLTSPDGRFSVVFPQGAVTDSVVITMKPYSLDQLKKAPSGAKLGTTCFEITGLSGLLSKDATVTATYSADDLAAADGDASQLKLAYYDIGQGQWIILPTQVNTQQMTLTATTDQLGIWVVMVSSSTSAGAPAAAPTKASLPAVLSIVALAATAIILGGTVRQRK